MLWILSMLTSIHCRWRTSRLQNLWSVHNHRNRVFATQSKQFALHLVLLQISQKGQLNRRWRSIIRFSNKSSVIRIIKSCPDDDKTPIIIFTDFCALGFFHFARLYVQKTFFIYGRKILMFEKSCAPGFYPSLLFSFKNSLVYHSSVIDNCSITSLNKLIIEHKKTPDLSTFSPIALNITQKFILGINQ